MALTSKAQRMIQRQRPTTVATRICMRRGSLLAAQVAERLAGLGREVERLLHPALADRVERRQHPDRAAELHAVLVGGIALDQAAVAELEHVAAAVVDPPAGRLDALERR